MSKDVQTMAVGVPRLGRALKQIREELAALSKDEILVVNLDPLAAISIARGALPKVLLLREQFVSTLPMFDLTYLDKLETYALALHQTHSNYCAARDRQEERTVLAAEAYQLRGAVTLRRYGPKEPRGYEKRQFVGIKGLKRGI